MTLWTIGLLALLPIQAQDGIDWKRDFDAACAQAAKEDRLLFVDFYHDW